MTAASIIQIMDQTRRGAPLIHCITNPISINQCANAVLAVGAKPIMAEHPEEVGEIAETAAALMLNLGNITDIRMKSMCICAACAKEKHIPFVLDLVGVACSRLRRRFAHELIGESVPTVIKGNYAEICAMYQVDYRTAGVDGDPTLSMAYISRIAAELAQKYSCTVLASGKTDIVTDGSRIICVTNGSPQLARVTGTGCMLGALTACFLNAANGISAACAACVVLGICGELAQTEKGNGSFMVNLMDALSTVSDVDIEMRLQMEEMQIEQA